MTDNANDLRSELAATYRLLRITLPLVFIMLKAGNVDLEDQSTFWGAVHELEEYVEVLSNDDLADEFLQRVEEFERDHIKRQVGSALEAVQ